MITKNICSWDRFFSFGALTLWLVFAVAAAYADLERPDSHTSHTSHSLFSVRNMNRFL